MTAGREKEHRHNKFMAALKGIDIDEENNRAKEKFDEVKRRAESKLTGVSEERLELRDDSELFGFDMEIEE